MRLNVMIIAVATLALGACGGPSLPNPGNSSKELGAASPVRPRVELEPKYEVVAEHVSFQNGERTIEEISTRPQVAGRYPAVLLHAGSGPTDRDWNSKLFDLVRAVVAWLHVRTE